MDIANMPAVYFGITVKSYNNDSVNLYFQMTGAATGYTFSTVNLGIVNAGANLQKNMDQFVARAKPSSGDLPSGELTEIITLTLKAYTDSGYTALKWTYNRSVHVYWINSADAAFTTDFSNNFDDGTVQGWSQSGGTSFAVKTDYVLSSPYSLGTRMSGEGNAKAATLWQIKIYKGTDILLFIGNPVDTSTWAAPYNKWVRIVVPLPQSTTLTYTIMFKWYAQEDTFYKEFTTPNRTTVYAIIDVRAWQVYSAPNYYAQQRMDDFKIISK